MVGVATTIESLHTVAPRVVTLVANTAADVLPDRFSEGGVGSEFVYRMLQNLTGANLFVAIDITADNVNNYHFRIGDGQTFNCLSKGRVSCFSVGGGAVSTFET